MIEAVRLEDISVRSGVTVVALITSFNRRSTTVRAAKALRAQTSELDICLGLVIADDASSDGTPGGVREVFPEALVFDTGGHAYWSRGMSKAQDVALSKCTPDYILWVNDDVDLYPGALDAAIRRCRSSGGRAIVVGATFDETTLQISYSGHRRIGSRPFQLERVTDLVGGPAVDTFNGNFVLVPRLVYGILGGVDPTFEHALGDIDYGYRAAHQAIPMVMLEKEIGQCKRNPFDETWRDPNLSPIRRWRLLTSKKEVPPRSRLIFLRRHGGPSWPIQWAAGYIRHALNFLVDAVSVRFRLSDPRR